MQKRPDPFNQLLHDIEAYFSGKPLTVGMHGIQKQIKSLPDEQKLELRLWVCDEYFLPYPLVTPKGMIIESLTTTE